MSSTSDTPVDSADLARTGIPGLDDVLGGGLTRNRMYLVEGVPGSGKTTLALQFLLEGARLGESVLYVTLSETREELVAVMASHGWTPDPLHLRELVPAPEIGLEHDEQNTMFHPSEIELSETTKLIVSDVDQTKASRVVIDSLSELRLLAGAPLRFRRQILALKQYFAARRCTVLVLDDRVAGAQEDLQVQSIAHGVIQLDHMNPDYGTDRRRLRIVKYRGRSFRGGHHDYVIRRGGVQVFPRLVAAEHRGEVSREMVASGIKALDAVLGGGLERGTSTLIVGAAGTGKSTIASIFAAAAARAGLRSAFFVFDESPGTLLRRSKGLGVDLARHLDAGEIAIHQVDPAELSPGELMDAIRREVENGVAILVIDSLNGYLTAMPAEKHLIVQLHELLSFLGQRGVATILVGTQQGLVGEGVSSTVDASYLADSVVLLRYFESQGEVRQAISIIKRRAGPHERAVRELRMEAGGVRIGPPLSQFRGVLTGVPIIESHTAAPPPSLP
jgi:circadian clock protein KaiC